MNTIPFFPADILLPKTSHETWAVVACDQFTSQRSYWEQTERIAAGAPSALRLILPEVYLSDGEEATGKRIQAIDDTMRRWLEGGVFDEFSDSMILTERTQSDGRVRYGVVGAIDLDAYDYSAGSTTPIRATEGTVLSRIPPRVKIRQGAALELPHVMLLCDDPLHTAIEPLAEKRETLRKVYDFELMQGGGHLRGYLLGKEEQAQLLSAFASLATGEEPLLFAVGDGNHSLASAKVASEGKADHRALVEVVNLHSPALTFEPIYRVLTGVEPEEVFGAARAFFTQGEKEVTLLAGENSVTLPLAGLSAGTVQAFIDGYLASHPGAEVDYIHGEEVVRSLAAEKNAVGFLFDGIAKEELFPYVAAKGALPRKTFSMGQANDKRYYMEARRLG